MYLVISNIPHSYHTKDLRNYFSYYIEKNAFEFFHYKHRPVENFLDHLKDIKLILAEKCENSNEFHNSVSFTQKSKSSNIKENEQFKTQNTTDKNTSGITKEIDENINNLVNNLGIHDLHSTGTSKQLFETSNSGSLNDEKLAKGLELVHIIMKETKENFPSTSIDFNNIEESEKLESKNYNENDVSSNILSSGISKLSDIVKIKKKDLSPRHPLAKIMERNKIKLTPKIDPLKPEEGKDRCCCFIKVKQEYVESFKKLYHKKFWVSVDGSILPIRCLIFDIRPLIQIQQVLGKDHEIEYLSRKVMKRIGRKINFQKLEEMYEFQGVSALPYGSVGTSNEFLKLLLRHCKLPSHLISKFGLPMHNERRKKRYSQVHLDYGTTIQSGGTHLNSDVIFTANGDLIPGYFDIKFNKVLLAKSSQPKPVLELIEEEEDGADVEEWERFEAFHNDVTKQERTKERVFESEIELVWEKGGPGLVFYTDEQFWRVHDGGNDEGDPDEWDVDMNPYYGEAGDDDAMSSLSMTEMNQLRNGEKSCSVFSKDVSSCKDAEPAAKLKKFGPHRRKFNLPPSDKRKCKSIIFPHNPNDWKTNLTHEASKDPESIGTFEQHTKGIGRRLLESQGWKAGQGLGRNKSGSPFALHNDGQHPLDKRGFGYSEMQNTPKILGKRTPPSNEANLLIGDEIPNIDAKVASTSIPNRNEVIKYINKSDSGNFPHRFYGYPIQFQKSKEPQ